MVCVCFVNVSDDVCRSAYSVAYSWYNITSVASYLSDRKRVRVINIESRNASSDLGGYVVGYIWIECSGSLTELEDALRVLFKDNVALMHCDRDWKDMLKLEGQS